MQLGKAGIKEALRKVTLGSAPWLCVAVVCGCDASKRIP